MVLSQLSQHLEAALAPEAVLPTIVETVARSLKLRFVAIALATSDNRRARSEDSSSPGDSFTIVSVYGAPAADPLRLPLIYQGETVGQLLVAPRAPGEPFTAAEERLLADIAHQAGVAAHSVRLMGDLQRAREQLVTAREEERRRLRRDLHDGLGPALASQMLALDTAYLLLERDPATVAEILRDLKTQSQHAVADIRRLIYDLRPPALDDLGLLVALREQAVQYRHTAVRIIIDAPNDLPPLPAAVEVAAYRIVQEAIINVIRHAHAHTCIVLLTVDDMLRVSVEDDGEGLPAEYRRGVGLHSMRERAAELGGTCMIETRAQRGTRVCVGLPLG